MKRFPVILFLLLLCAPAFAEEAEHGGGGGHKAPPVPSKGTPVGDVYNLPQVMEWKRWMEAHRARMTVWGESISIVDGHKCWRVGVGQAKQGHTDVWKQFCVPEWGGAVLVASKVPGSDDEFSYLPYAEWVEKCKPTEDSAGSC